MTSIEIKTLPAAEKVRIMEAIWEDMRDHCEESPVPQEVIEVLRERQSRVACGEAKLLEWDQVKFAIGRG